MNDTRLWDELLTQSCASAAGRSHIANSDADVSSLLSCFVEYFEAADSALSKRLVDIECMKSRLNEVSEASYQLSGLSAAVTAKMEAHGQRLITGAFDPLSMGYVDEFRVGDLTFFTLEQAYHYVRLQAMGILTDAAICKALHPELLKFIPLLGKTSDKWLRSPKTMSILMTLISLKYQNCPEFQESLRAVELPIVQCVSSFSSDDYLSCGKTLAECLAMSDEARAKGFRKVPGITPILRNMYGRALDLFRSLLDYPEKLDQECEYALIDKCCISKRVDLTPDSVVVVVTEHSIDPLHACVNGHFRTLPMIESNIFQQIRRKEWALLTMESCWSADTEGVAKLASIPGLHVVVFLPASDVERQDELTIREIAERTTAFLKLCRTFLGEDVNIFFAENYAEDVDSPFNAATRNAVNVKRGGQPPDMKVQHVALRKRLNEWDIMFQGEIMKPRRMVYEGICYPLFEAVTWVLAEQMPFANLHFNRITIPQVARPYYFTPHQTRWWAPDRPIRFFQGGRQRGWSSSHSHQAERGWRGVQTGGKETSTPECGQHGRDAPEENLPFAHAEHRAAGSAT